MAKKDNDNFNFETETEGKVKFDLAGFFNNLTKQQKGVILAAIVGIVLIAAMVVVLCILSGSFGGSDNSSNNNGNNNGGWFTPDSNNDNTYISIYLSASPEKTVYNVGDELNTNGIVLSAMKSDGTTNTVYYNEHENEITISGFDSSSVVKQQTITISYMGLTCTYTIEVKDFSITPPTLISIKVDPLPKTQYKVDEMFTVEGGKIVCTYDDGSTKTIDLTPNHVSGFGAMSNGVGEYTITVKLRDNGVLYKTTYTITVTE